MRDVHWMEKATREQKMDTIAMLLQVDAAICAARPGAVRSFWVGEWQDRSTWEVDFTPAATVEDKLAVWMVINTFQPILQTLPSFNQGIAAISSSDFFQPN